MKSVPKLAPGLSIALSVGMMLIACSPTVVNPGPSQNPPTQNGPLTVQPPQAAQTHRVEFKVAPNLAASFKTQQTANATAAYVRMVITNGTDTLYASGADSNGFLQVQGSGTITLAADVPEGKFWVATIGFYTQPPVSSGTQPTPFLELKTAFDSPVTGQVNIDYGTYLKGAIVDELRKLSSPLLTGNTAIELNALQAYTDALTGKTVNGQSLSFSKLNSLNPPIPQGLDVRQIAATLNGMQASQITPTFGTNQVILNLLPLPQFMGIYPNPSATPRPASLGGLGRGIDQGIAMNRGLGSGDDKLFFADTADTDTSGANSADIEFLHGLQYNFSTSVFTTLFDKMQFDQIRSPQIVLGRANPSASSSIFGIFFTNQAANTLTLSVRDQSNGSLIWNYAILNVANANPAFAPVLKRLNNGSCACDDEHMAIVAVKHTDNTSKIYGVRQERSSYPAAPAAAVPTALTTGFKMWEYTAGTGTQNVMPGGALSSDGSKFYALVSTTSNASTQKLLILDANTGADVVTPITLPASSSAAGSPVVGKNGAVYVVIRQGLFSSLVAYNGTTGAQLWAQPYTLNASSSTSAEISPVVDYDGAQDIVYVIESRLGPSTYPAPVMHAIKGDGTAKWSTPFSFGTKGSVPATGMLIGAEANGTRVIYAGLTDGKVYAIRDNGSTGSLDWGSFPNGSVWSSNTLYQSQQQGMPRTMTWNGFSLHSGRLFVATRDGGEGQSTHIQTLKVSTPEMPTAAPWPKTGGNLRNSGVSQLMTNQE